jgi:hypothetical protein
MSDAKFDTGAELFRNYAWTSGNGRALLRLQEDGNFVLYKDGKAAWQAKNAYPAGYHAIFQDDGNLVVYDEGKEPLWASNTEKNRGAILAVQDDGNVVIYQNGKTIWATNTND